VRNFSNNVNSMNGAAHANSADVFNCSPTPYRARPEILASQPVHRVESEISTSHPTSHAYSNRTGTVNIPKKDRIYGDLRDNRLGAMGKLIYPTGNGKSNGNGSGNMNSRNNGNGGTRRGRDNRNSSAPQPITDGYNNNNAFAPDASRFAHNNYNPPQRPVPVNRMLFQEPPTNQVSAYRAQIPHQTQLPSPLAVFNAPPDPFAAPSRLRSAAIADMIRSGAMDDGQSLDPDARTPTTGSDRHQRRLANSVQYHTPTRTRGSRGARRNFYGDASSSSEQSSAMTTPSRDMRAEEHYGTTATRTPASSLLHGQTLPPPPWLHNAQILQPTLDEAMASLPFSNRYETVSVRGFGVVKFTNIPYGTLRSELIAALGRSARPVSMPQGSPFYAVHIIMDRNTGKTQDGFVEVPTARDAQNTVRAIIRRVTEGSRPLKIGNREVTVEVATTEELMTALFPHATTVEWTGYIPRILDVDTQFYPGPSGAGIAFTGFCGNEELAMLVKFAENSSRVSRISLIFMRHTR
jgi:hypothetical protein